jgi:arylsulfatase A-like enzyme
LAPEFGIGQGFEIYDAERLSLGQVATKALAWLDEQPQRPFFLFLHTYQVHHPYDLDPESRKVLASEYAGPLPDHISVDLLRSVNQGDLELSEADRRHILQAYDAGIRRMDEEFGTFLGELQERELFARSLVVFTSDHGEEFGEHGWWGWHSHSLYDELLAVPLVIKRPGNEGAGTVVQRQVRLIDVAPTILRALEIPAPPSFQGVDLFETGDEAPREALPAIALRDTEARDREAIRFRGWKWYHGSLFDLSADPLEQVDLAASRPEVFNRLQKILVDELEAGVSREGPEANPDRETMERLRSLGYVQ